MKYFKLIFIMFFCLIFSCQNPDLIFFADEIYYKTVVRPVGLKKMVKMAAKKRGLTAKLVYIQASEDEPDLSSMISSSKAKAFIFSPWLAKRIPAYSRLITDRLFISLEANGTSNSGNLSVVIKDREDFFFNLAEIVYQYQRQGKKVGTVFLLNETRRNQEKEIFKKELNQLNHGNYHLIEYPIYKTDISRIPREIGAKMIREKVSLLLLFGASFNNMILEQMPSNGEIQCITESLLFSDQVYHDIVLFSGNYHYEEAFEQVVEAVISFKQREEISSEEQNIKLKCYREYIGASKSDFIIDKINNRGVNANQNGFEEVWQGLLPEEAEAQKASSKANSKE